MKHIEVNIGKACNNKCRFCMSAKFYIDKISKFSDGEKYNFVEFQKIKKEITKYAKLNYDSIGFLGGEISIHPNLYDIIGHSKNQGFKQINIITNGMIFDNYKKAEKLIISGTTRVNISVHSHLDRIEDYLTQIKGGLKRKLKAIDNFNKLIKKGILNSNLSINIVLNGLNNNTIVETVLYFWKKKNINDIRINFIWPRFFETEKDKNDLMLNYEDFLENLKKLIYISVKYNIRITFDSIPVCIFYKIDKINYKNIIKKFLGEDFDYINEISNINKNEVFSWKKQKKEELKMKFKNCGNCVYNNICEGVWKEYVEKYGESEFYYIK